MKTRLVIPEHVKNITSGTKILLSLSSFDPLVCESTHSHTQTHTHTYTQKKHIPTHKNTHTYTHTHEMILYSPFVAICGNLVSTL